MNGAAAVFPAAAKKSGARELGSIIDYIEYLDSSRIEDLAAGLTAQESATLEAINQKVAAAQSLEEVMDFLFERSKEIFPCDRLSVAFLEDRGKRLVSKWVRASYEPVLLKKNYNEDITQSSLQEVIRRGCPRIINNLPEYLTRKPDSLSSRLLVKEGVQSSMTCPLTVNDRIVGLLFRSSQRADAYDGHQVMLHAKLAERLSQAVEKAYQIDQLTAANKAYMEVLSFASHELKSPLAAIVMDGRLLLDGYLGTLPPKQAEKVGAMIGRAQNLLDITREYLDLSRYEGGQLHANFRSARFKDEVLDPVLESFRRPSEARGMVTTLELQPAEMTVVCDPALMQTAFTNLIGNAVKYGGENGIIRIRAELKEQKLVCAVWNSGPGFPKDQRSRLFKRFSRLDTPEFKRVRGTGVGLYLVWQIVNLHGGKIEAQSEYGQWAEFAFEIPQA